MEENEIKEEINEAAEPQTENAAAEAAEEAPKKEKKRFGKKNDAKVEELTNQVQEMGEKLSEMNDKYVRTVAEFENYRKRTNAERADLILNGGKDVIKSILPIIDDLERALQAMTDENAKEGVTMIYNKMMNTLQQKGLKAMEAKGEKFNEEFHEAVTQIPAPTEEQKGTVLDVVEKGYFLNDKVLRYAKVVYAM
ncbi:MAG: nucleotide exchange factor GrpE [Bacteroidales bacterium]|nr:nucleotide exchange factor GrpE [Bacteroidales bacterium]